MEGLRAWEAGEPAELTIAAARPAPGKVSLTSRLPVQYEEDGLGRALASPTPPVTHELPLHVVIFEPDAGRTQADLAHARGYYAQLGIRLVVRGEARVPNPPRQELDHPNGPAPSGHPLDHAEDGMRSTGQRPTRGRGVEVGTDEGIDGNGRRVAPRASDEATNLLARYGHPGELTAFWVAVPLRVNPNAPPTANGNAFDSRYYENVQPGREGLVISSGASREVLAHELGHLLLHEGHHPDGDNLMSSGRGRHGSELTEDQRRRILQSEYLRPVGAPQTGRRLAQPATAETTTPGRSPDEVQAAAAHGLTDATARLPYADVIAGAFGRHAIDDVRVAIGGSAADASATLGAHAYASGDRIAFARAPDLRLAAHEAAHVVQQRAGVQLADGLGRAGDPYEQHADAVADAVVRGASAEALLDQGPGGGGASGAIQRYEEDVPPARAAQLRRDARYPGRFAGRWRGMSEDERSIVFDAMAQVFGDAFVGQFAGHAAAGRLRNGHHQLRRRPPGQRYPAPGGRGQMGHPQDEGYVLRDRQGASEVWVHPTGVEITLSGAAPAAGPERTELPEVDVPTPEEAERSLREAEAAGEGPHQTTEAEDQALWDMMDELEAEEQAASDAAP